MNRIFTLNHPLHSIFRSDQYRTITEITLFFAGIALLALSAQFVIPIGPVPLTFQSATVVLIGMLYGSRLGGITILGYLFAGCAGVPMFAGMSSGISPFFGTTMGYLLGFLPAAMLGGFLAERGWASTTIGAFVAACLSASVIFVLGVSALSHFVGWDKAILLGFVPFMTTEPLKLLAVALIVPRFWKSAR
jgi:biotin transport system substrate-specific component